jgi:hypothetical protein
LGGEEMNMGEIKKLNELTKDELLLRKSALDKLMLLIFKYSWSRKKLKFIDKQWMRLSRELQRRK